MLVFDDEKNVIDLSYVDDYAFAFINNDDKHAVSMRYPVSYYLDCHEDNWLSFLDDLIPSGAGRKYWLDYLDLHRLGKGEQAYQLLRHGTVAPIGNMRIKESIEHLPDDGKIRYFDREDAENRSTDFLEYAQERGTIVGGATGAGGEAPKMLLRCNAENQIWIDNLQNDVFTQDPHYLVKYPRGLKNSRDCDILRAEYHCCPVKKSGSV